MYLCKNFSLRMKYTKYLTIALLMVVIDHIIKIWVHDNLELDSVASEIPLIGEWFRLHYTLNPGMAFGMQLPAPYGKIILSVFRLIAVCGIAWYIHSLCKKNAHWGLLTCMSLVLGGAVGNVVDSTFYGVLLDNAPLDSPTPWFHGQVIDMFYVRFPITSRIPEWMPFWGGLPYSTPIFNFADASIFVGVMFILIFQRKFFLIEEENKLITATPTSDIVKNNSENSSENSSENNSLETSATDKNFIENTENNVSDIVSEKNISTENIAPTNDK